MQWQSAVVLDAKIVFPPVCHTPTSPTLPCPSLRLQEAPLSPGTTVSDHTLALSLLLVERSKKMAPLRVKTRTEVAGIAGT